MMSDMEGKCGRKFKKWSSDNEESDACDKWSRKGKIGKWSKLGQSTKTSGGKFKAYVRLMGYQAEGLEIKAAEGWLTVTGKHDETSEDGNEQVSRNFTKKFKIPADAKVDEIRTKLVKHGRFLKVIVPLNNAGQDIPVTIVPSAPSENEAMERLVI
ncbi:hypothetical protein HDE_05979 [Halotydeus destructor]|nr:hypothetical protein HDE_05979 [Halotydeus destructor]